MRFSTKRYLGEASFWCERCS